MIETREKEIGNSVYSVTQLPARRALRLKAKLIRLFGPTITQLFLSAEDKEEVEIPKNESENLSKFEMGLIVKHQIRTLQNDRIVKGIELLSSSIDEKTFDELVLEIVSGVRRNGVEMLPGNIDHDFAGNLMELYKVIWFVIEVNYADFFGESGIGNLSQSLNPQDQDTKKTYTYK